MVTDSISFHYSSTSLTQQIGLTGEKPETSKLPQSRCVQQDNDEHMLCIRGNLVIYKGKILCNLDGSTENVSDGQSSGILLTRGRDLHCFVDDKWRGMVHVDDYPLDRPLWGVTEVFARCKQVKAEICSGESHTVLRTCMIMRL